jgi:hypothetical protein
MGTVARCVASSFSRDGKPIAQYLIIGIQSYRSFKVMGGVKASGLENRPL